MSTCLSTTSFSIACAFLSMLVSLVFAFVSTLDNLVSNPCSTPVALDISASKSDILAFLPTSSFIKASADSLFATSLAKSSCNLVMSALFFDISPFIRASADSLADISSDNPACKSTISALFLATSSTTAERPSPSPPTTKSSKVDILSFNPCSAPVALDTSLAKSSTTLSTFF